jgi:hypothetical protein
MESIFHLFHNGRRPEAFTKASFEKRIDLAKKATQEMLTTLTAGRRAADDK